MGFWIFMFCCTLLIPIIMIIAGNSMRLGKFKTLILSSATAPADP